MVILSLIGTAVALYKKMWYLLICFVRKTHLYCLVSESPVSPLKENILD
jgi:hypothetical protein